MSLSLDGGLVLLGLLVPAGLCVVIVTVPRWFIRSMSKHAFWRLRDDVVDDRIAGRLPLGHPAVEELLARTEWAIKETRSLDLLNVWVWARARRELPEDTLKALAQVPRLNGLDTESAKRVERYRKRYNSVAIRTLLLSSWTGVAVVLSVGVPTAVSAVRHHARKNALKGVVVRATEEVATETRIGHDARLFVTDKGPEREAALV